MAIDVLGLREALAKIDELARRSEDLTPAWLALVKPLHEMTMRRFQPGGQWMWPALKHPHPGPMLVKSGAMRDAIKYAVKKNALRQFVSASRMTGIPYAWYQQVGSKYKRYMSFSQAEKALNKGLVKLDRSEKRSKYHATVKDQSGLIYVGKSRQVFNQKTGEVDWTKAVRREQAGRGGLLPRPFLFLLDDDLEMINESINEWLVGSFDGKTKAVTP